MVVKYVKVTDHTVVKIKDCGLSFSLFSFFILFFLIYFFIFSIFRNLGLGIEVIGHTVTSVTFDGMVTASVIRLKIRK